MKDLLNLESLADQDSSVVLSVGVLSLEEEIDEERKQDAGRNEHIDLNVSALENSIKKRLSAASAGRPRRKAPSTATSQVPEAIGPDVVDIARSIRQRLPESKGLPSRKAPSTLYQVPRVLRQGDEDSYQPQLISIGPYHHGKECLRPMDGQKFQHLRKILARNENIELEDYIKGIMDLEKRARKCYSRSISQINKNDFVKMMLLDGCFLVEIFLQNHVADGNVPEIYEEMWLRDFISHDMLLLENQLPYFILKCIFNLVEKDRKNVGSMAKLVLDCFKFIPVMPLNNAAPVRKSYHHLVHLFHYHCLPTFSEINRSGDGLTDSSIKSKLVRLVKDSVTSFSPCEPNMPSDLQLPSMKASTPKQGLKPKAAVMVKAVIDYATSFFLCSHEEMRPGESDQRKPPLSIPSAEELEEAGVVFKRKKKRGSFLSIEFHKNIGVMEIPYFYFNDDIISIFRNFVAFEQCRYPNADTFFMSYVLFMDCLIHTDRDAKILRRSGVLGHGLGSDEEVARVFNQMARVVYWDADVTRLSGLYNGVNAYCGIRRHVWRANLMHNYFNTPWAILSFVAALSLLILTAMQTFFSFHPHK